MRDRNRIRPLLNKLEDLWEQMPDMRLGQLIVNLNKMAGYGNDAFYIEDDFLSEIIDTWKSEIENNPIKQINITSVYLKNLDGITQSSIKEVLPEDFDVEKTPLFSIYKQIPYEKSDNKGENEEDI